MTSTPEENSQCVRDALTGANELTDKQQAFDTYKLYLEMVDRISDRREKANGFFLAVSAALLTLLSKGPDEPIVMRCVVPLASCILCVIWARMIRSYRDLNTAKFKIVHALEQHLEVRPYVAEWEAVERGNNPRLYLPFTHVEKAVPWLFFWFNVALLLYVVVDASIAQASRQPGGG